MNIAVIISAAALVVVSILIILVTMLQEEKGDGMGSSFGELGSFEGQRGQSREMILKKYTRVLAIVFAVLIIATNLVVFIVK